MRRNLLPALATLCGAATLVGGACSVNHTSVVDEATTAPPRTMPSPYAPTQSVVAVSASTDRRGRGEGAPAVDAPPPPSSPVAIAPPATPGEIAIAPPPVEEPPSLPSPPEPTGPLAPLAALRFASAAQQPLSTFSIDVDTASYAHVRNLLRAGERPPRDAIRLEELVNYFPYDDAPPAAGDDAPVALHAEAADCPWAPGHRLVRVALKGRPVELARRPASNLVFLIDVSGSMSPPERLPLVQRALALLVEQLDERDRVSLVVYAGSSGLVLPPTSGADKRAILGAIDRLSAGGSTNGGAGIELAYRVARQAFVPGGVNRVLLATDGDFNVGITDRRALVDFVSTQAKQGVALTTLGVGMGNYKDRTMEELADHGDGNAAYLDSLDEARKVLVEQAAGTLLTLARDVKLQLAWDPRVVRAYRLLGYDDRRLRKEDFDDDGKDAGELGAGHTVTALYEVIETERPDRARAPMVTVRLRYKPPTDMAAPSRLLQTVAHDDGRSLAAASSDLRFGAAVAGFSLLLRGEAPAALRFADVKALAAASLGKDPQGRRAELLELIDRAGALARAPVAIR